MTSTTVAGQQPVYAWPTDAAEEKHLRNPVLAALKNTEYGHLAILTPEGKHLMFSGVEHGPMAQMEIHDWRALREGVARGQVGFAEGYMDRRWDSRDLPAMLTFALMNTPALERFFYGRPWYAAWMRFREWLCSNSLAGSRRNIMSHYDLGNSFYRLWLDSSMTYSCALFEGDQTRTLEEAQKAKYQRILRRIRATPGQHILDIGCGWGGFAEEAARAGLQVTGITISDAQADYAEARMQAAGLAHLVRIERKDYRNMEGQFDHVVSIGMFEHVGESYWPAYFNAVCNRLRPGGRALIQSITIDDRIFESLHDYYGFMERYIFPGGLLPSKMKFFAAASNAGLACRDMFAFGQDYARTLRCWLNRFEANTGEVKQLGYDERFIRLWRFYLSSCIASFVTCRTDVMQVELTHAQ